MKTACNSNYTFFISDYSPEIIVQGRKRQESIKEFIQTERSYVKDMSIVREVFEIPLRLSKLIPAKDIDDIFVNWQDIIQCNKTFLRELMRSYDAGRDMVGDIICRHVSNFFWLFNRHYVANFMNFISVTKNDSLYNLL